MKKYIFNEVVEKGFDNGLGGKKKISFFNR